MRALRLSKNGWVWEIDASFVADQRAKYYAEKGDDYQQEYDYTINDAYELVDWYTNNMNWEDVPVENRRVIVRPPLVVYPESDWEVKAVN